MLHITTIAFLARYRSTILRITLGFALFDVFKSVLFVWNLRRLRIVMVVIEVEDLHFEEMAVIFASLPLILQSVCSWLGSVLFVQLEAPILIISLLWVYGLLDKGICSSLCLALLLARLLLKLSYLFLFRSFNLQMIHSFELWKILLSNFRRRTLLHIQILNIFDLLQIILALRILGVLISHSILQWILSRRLLYLTGFIIVTLIQVVGAMTNLIQIRKPFSLVLMPSLLFSNHQ